MFCCYRKSIYKRAGWTPPWWRRLLTSTVTFDLYGEDRAKHEELHLHNNNNNHHHLEVYFYWRVKD